MEITETQAPPVPPNIFKALRGGFDAIANRVYIILIPLVLDVWLWLGPHIQIKNMLTGYLQALWAVPGFDPAQSGGLLPADLEILSSFLERINLMTILRSYPVGIPSLVTGSLPLLTPVGKPAVLDVNSPLIAIGIWAGLTLAGLAAGTLYFMVIGQIALNGKVELRQILKEWPRRLSQIVLLTFALMIMLVILLVPSSCMLSLISMGGIPVTQFALIILAAMLIWVLFPLVLTPHGIIVRRDNLLMAIQRSLVLTRMNMPTTMVFFLVILMASQLLDMLWRVPVESSWFTIVGLAGHAFAASSLLAATFVYYRAADRWAQNLAQKVRMNQAGLS